MRELTLGGLHDDSDHLVLLDAEGERYTVKIDEALRAAVRRDTASLGLIQNSSQSSLRPKDIQALLRSGSSVESIAELSGLPVERIQRYEGPVLAERAHMAERAQSFRTSRGSADILGTIVAGRLAARSVEGETSWDAWRRADGSWTLQLQFASAQRQRSATWHVDVPNRIVTAEDDEARWLSDSDDSLAEPSTGPRLYSVRSDVFDVDAHNLAKSQEVSIDSSTISESTLDELNARRGTPVSSSPWKSLDDANLMADDAEHTAGVDSANEEKVAPVRIVPLAARHHEPSENADALQTEEVSYVDAPEDLNRSIDQEPFSAAPEEDGDPASDPSATESGEAEQEDGQEAEHSDDLAATNQAEDSSEESSAEPEESNDQQLKLTPLPGFDDASQSSKPSKKPKKGRASIPSWDDIVFGKKDK